MYLNDSLIRKISIRAQKIKATKQLWVQISDQTFDYYNEDGFVPSKNIPLQPTPQKTLALII